MLLKLNEKQRGLGTFPGMTKRTLAHFYAAGLIFELFSHILAVLKIHLHILFKKFSYCPLSLLLIVLQRLWSLQPISVIALQ